MRPAVRRWARWGVVVAVGVAVVVGAGLIPIGSSGHWRVTNTVLDLVKRRSVALRAVALTAPDLSAPNLVALGAAHYEGGCRTCHGRPGLVLPLVPRRMTPHPPDLARQVGRWSAEELFYIVKHGIKFTGMPAWPYADRDDEMWAVVAFVRRLPEMDAPTYERLTMTGASGAIEATADSSVLGAAELTALRTCARCHGRHGEGRVELVPRLAGQRAVYLREALDAYASGARRSGIMGPIAAGLPPDVTTALATHYASALPTPVVPAPPEPALSSPIALGAAIATSGRPEQDVPACVVCHPTNATVTVNPAYPDLAGLAASYLERQLQLFAEGRRGGGPSAHLMREAVAGLSVQQRQHVAAFYAAKP